MQVRQRRRVLVLLAALTVVLAAAGTAAAYVWTGAWERRVERAFSLPGTLRLGQWRLHQAGTWRGAALTWYDPQGQQLMSAEQALWTGEELTLKGAQLTLTPALVRYLPHALTQVGKVTISSGTLHCAGQVWQLHHTSWDQHTLALQGERLGQPFDLRLSPTQLHLRGQLPLAQLIDSGAQDLGLASCLALPWPAQAQLELQLNNQGGQWQGSCAVVGDDGTTVATDLQVTAADTGSVLVNTWHIPGLPWAIQAGRVQVGPWQCPVPRLSWARQGSTWQWTGSGPFHFTVQGDQTQWQLRELALPLVAGFALEGAHGQGRAGQGTFTLPLRGPGFQAELLAQLDFPAWRVHLQQWLGSFAATQGQDGQGTLLGATLSDLRGAYLHDGTGLLQAQLDKQTLDLRWTLARDQLTVSVERAALPQRWLSALLPQAPQLGAMELGGSTCTFTSKDSAAVLQARAEAGSFQAQVHRLANGTWRLQGSDVPAAALNRLLQALGLQPFPASEDRVDVEAQVHSNHRLSGWVQCGPWQGQVGGTLAQPSLRLERPGLRGELSWQADGLQGRVQATELAAWLPMVPTGLWQVDLRLVAQHSAWELAGSLRKQGLDEPIAVQGQVLPGHRAQLLLRHQERQATLELDAQHLLSAGGDPELLQLLQVPETAAAKETTP